MQITRNKVVEAERFFSSAYFTIAISYTCHECIQLVGSYCPCFALFPASIVPDKTPIKTSERVLGVSIYGTTHKIGWGNKQRQRDNRIVKK